MTKRVISFFLSLIMLIAILPPAEVWAVEGKVPAVAKVEPIIGNNYIILKGTVTDEGDSSIIRYGFGYKVIGVHNDYVWTIEERSIAENKAFSFEIPNLEVGDIVHYVIVAGNKYGEGKQYCVATIKEQWSVSTSIIKFEAEGGTSSFSITATSSYSIKPSNPWIVISDKDGSSDKTIKVTCEKNTSNSSRTGFINVIHHASGATFVIDISQEGKIDELEISEDYFEFDSNGGEEIIEVYASDDYTISSNSSWITISPSRGSGNGTISITCKTNTTSWERYGEITVTLTSTGEKSTIEVFQYGDENDDENDDENPDDYWLDVDKIEIAATYNQSNYQFLVTSNVTNWSITTNTGWIRVSPTVGSNNASITVYVDENKNESSRNGVITVSGNGISKTISVTQTGVKNNDSTIIGDLNSDGQVTLKDRFILNRHLAGMVGYESINKNLADINGDGNVTQEDASILERHLSGWIGYENLDSFYKVSTPPINNVPKWDMSFSFNAVTIELELKEGSLDTNRRHLFIAENSKGLHYTGIIEPGKTSVSFSVKAMQMPRGEMYSFYIIPEGIALAGNEDTYCIGKSVVPLFNGNMITSVKSGGRSIAKNGNVFLGDAVTINWDGSFGVDNFTLVVTLNGSEIYSQTFDHDGPGTVTISADKITANGVGTLIISGYVQPSAASGLATAVSVWSGNVVKYEISPDDQNNSIDWLNEDARALYNKNEELAYLQLDTYYYWQAFVDELTGFKHWGSALQHVRTYISNYINSVFSTPSLNLDTQGHALLKQAIRTKLVEMMKADSNLDENHWQSFSNTQESVLDGAMQEISNIDNANDAIQPIMKSMALSADAQEKIIKSIADSFDFSTFNGFKDPNALISKIVTKFSNHSIDYEGKTYKLTDFFNLNENTALQIKVKLQSIKKAKKATDISNAIGDAKKTYAVVAEKLDKASGVISDILLGAELAGRFMVHADDMIALVNLHYKFDEYEKMLQNMVQSSDGLFQACIVEVMDELRGSAVKLVLAESATDLGKLVVDKLYDKLVGDAISSLHPYVKLAKISNDIITGLADTDSINKGELTLPYILDAMNNTISKISYNYSMFMTNPSNELYYELEALFITYKFQVELGAEVYLNLCTVDHNSHLKRFYRFVNPFDKDDKMPEEFQTCYKQDIAKLNYVLNWFGFN